LAAVQVAQIQITQATRAVRAAVRQRREREVLRLLLRERQIKAMPVERHLLAHRHGARAVAAVQVRLGQTEQAPLAAMEVQVLHRPSPDRASPMGAVAAQRQHQELRAAVDRAVAAQAAFRQRELPELQIRVAGVEQDLAQTRAAQEVQALSSSKCHQLLMPHSQAA
jgi:hypothetical protein